MGDSTENITADKTVESAVTAGETTENDKNTVKTEKTEKSGKAAKGGKTAGKKKSKDDKSGKVGFWKGIKAEFKKITWPDRETTLKQGVSVVVVTIVLGIIISVLDLFIQYGVNFITSIG